MNQDGAGGADKLAERKRLRLRSGRSETASLTAVPWLILVVDDEPDVHAMTRVILRDLRFKERPFKIISAHSADEARQVLAQHPDIPLALVDVVMETPHAGLDLIRHIREELHNHRMAIVLRTGQPGEAPEQEVMLGYDINDYRGKTELTAQKLFSALVGGLRSWINLSTIENLNESLERRVEERTSQLDRARRFAETLVDMLPHPLWYKDCDGRLKIRNRAFDDMFGRPSEDGALPTALAEMDRHCDLVVLGEDGGALGFEATLDLPDGPRTVLVSKGRVNDCCCGQDGTVGLITDITERKRMEHQLRQMATTDELTGALVRRAFFTAAEQELERAQRYGNPLSVVMVDLDHFKQINDSHGHGVGDIALRLAAAALARTLREVDVLGRLGGEEFAVLLPETGLVGATEVAERLRAAIASVTVPVGKGAAPLSLAASLGVAERGPDEKTVDRVLARADAALYRAKAMGRNRVEA